MDGLEHTVETKHPLDKRAEEFARHLQQAVDDLRKQGSSRGLERQLSAETKLRKFRMGPGPDGSRRPGALASVIEILELTFERWLSRVDRSADLRADPK